MPLSATLAWNWWARPICRRGRSFSSSNHLRARQVARAWWCDRVAEWADAGVADVYVVVNNHYEGHAPATIRALAEALVERGLDVAAGAGRPEGQLPLF